MLKRFLLALAAALAIALPAAATSVVPLYLDEIVDQSATAFQGVCLANRSARDPATGMIVTYTTFQVTETLKGTVGATHTIKQVGGELPAEGMGLKVQGVPKFAVGESYVVFLAGVSDAGFSSPIGLGQGRFTITPDAGVGNGRDFRELFARMAPRTMTKAGRAALDAGGPVHRIPLADLKSAVHERLGAQR